MKSATHTSRFIASLRSSTFLHSPPSTTIFVVAEYKEKYLMQIFIHYGYEGEINYKFYDQWLLSSPHAIQRRKLILAH